MEEPRGQESSPLQVPEIAECLAGRSELWIFAYGSLMWDPCFAYGEAQPALLRGYHRSFCIYSRRYRGTPERPGLVLGLDRGGACKGIAFHVPAAEVASALMRLWQRELTQRTYRLKELPLETRRGAVLGRALVVDRRHPSYAGRLPLADMARHIVDGIGTRGSCRQYLENTVGELRKLGLEDGPVHRLADMVRELAARERPCALGKPDERGDAFAANAEPPHPPRSS
jgi:glutathione-specific gamma-glutamylcyclotransferase